MLLAASREANHPTMHRIAPTNKELASLGCQQCLDKQISVYALLLLSLSFKNTDGRIHSHLPPCFHYFGCHLFNRAEATCKMTSAVAVVSCDTALELLSATDH